MNVARAVRHLFLFWLVAFGSIAACADAGTTALGRRRSSAASADAGSGLAASERSTDVRVPPVGVPDRGRTSALMVLEVATSPRCAATLVASNIALAPARCLTRFSGCQRSAPSSLVVRSGDDRRELVAGVREIVVGDPCDDDALVGLVLSRHADGLAPLVVRTRPAVRGEFVRAALLSGAHTAGALERVIRDHLRVEVATKSDLAVGGESCAVLPGGALLDEATGELVGISSKRTHEDCDAGTSSFLQIDEARTLIEQSLVRAAAPALAPDGGVSNDGGAPRRGKAAKPTLDLGEPCESGDECAAGVCVFDATAGYCSRSCGPGDRCPTSMRCERLGDGPSVCVRSR